MRKPYEPQGRAGILMEAMRNDDPSRRWTYVEIGRLLDFPQKNVGKTVEKSVKHGVMHFGFIADGHMAVSLTPFPASQRQKPPKRGRAPKPQKKPMRDGWTTDPNDPRIQKVVRGWVPPQMVCVRLA